MIGSRPRGPVGILFALALASNAARGLAVERRVGIVRGDEELARQLTLALQAWEVETLALDANAPAMTQPEAMSEAAALATREALDGVVWLTVGPEEGSLLWVYDARTGEVTTRAISERPPLGSATAAGLALSVKTTLRASVEPPPPPPPPPPAPKVVLPPTLPARPRPVPSAARAQLSAGLDAQAVAKEATRAWYSLRSIIWLNPSRRVGLGLQGGFGSALSLAATNIDARYRELAFGPTLQVRLAASPAFIAQAFFGGALHAVTLSGTLKRDGTQADVTRYNLAVDAGGRFDWRVAPGTLLGVQLGAAYFLGYQRFTVEGATVFAPWRLVPSGGAHVGFELF